MMIGRRTPPDLYLAFAKLSGVRAIGAFEAKWGRVPRVHDEIGSMRAAVKCLRIVQSDEHGQRVLRTLRDFRTGGRSALTPGIPIAEQLLDETGEFLRIKINEKLERHALICVGSLNENELGNFALTMVGRDLLGVMWLQIARALAQGRADGICRQCGKAFTVKRTGARGHQFCSTRCRVAHHRAQ